MKKILTFLIICSVFRSEAQGLCAGSSTTLQAGNPQNLSGPQYSMNPGNFPSTTGVFVVSPNVTTTYTLYTTGSNGTAVVTTSAVTTVTVKPQPIATPTVVQPTCSNSLTSINLGLTFNPPTPAPGYTISWANNAPPNGFLTPVQTTVNSYIPAGPFTATITANGGCQTIVSFTVNTQPTPANFTINPAGTQFSVTCVDQTITISASEANYTYTWTNPSIAPITIPTIEVHAGNLGTWTVTGRDPISECTKTFTFGVSQYTNTPVSTISPTLQNVTCNQTSMQTISVTANPTVNVSHFFYAPQGGTASVNSHTAVYVPGGIGTFTHCLIDLVTGCSSCNTFTVASNEGFPTYSLLTSPVGFTLGCTTKSVTNLIINNAASSTLTPGAPISYTIIGPPTSTAIQTGSLSGNNTFSINTPGTWTAVVRDNTSGCDTRTPFSVISNTFGPDISAVVPRQILDCTFTTTILQAQTASQGVSYIWGFQGVPGSQPGTSITVNSLPASPNQTLINTYTLTIKYDVSTCESKTVIPMFQNRYTPNVAITGAAPITCIVNTVQLTNNSTTGIQGTTFPKILPVIGYIWQGPPPQEDAQVSTSYVAGTPGTYTLTGKDLNNGCVGTATAFIADNRDYPVVNPIITPQPLNPPYTATLDCGAAATNVTPTINTPTSGLTFTWLPPSNSASLNGQNSLVLSTNLPGNYTVIVANPNGCVTSATMQVITGSLTGNIAASHESGFAPQAVSFVNNSSSSNSTSNITTFWSFGNGTSSITPQASVSPVVTYSLPGTYTVTAFVGKGACRDTAYQVITVEIPSELKVPNIFTPNGDGVNDLFFVKSTNLSNIHMLIYDRWGALVYELATDKHNVAWDGKNQYGKEVAEGTYFYVLKATGSDGKTYDEKGTVNLVR